MTSSLAAQLAGIRSHNAARLASSSALTSRDSYLFPSRVAAEQDHATVHALGVTGWEQLMDEDATLAQWPHGELLFGEQSIKLDRTTLPKSSNDEIDAAVRELLYLLGPVLLSRSAAKVLEWLVRRFRVHEYSPRDVLHAFLPYHLTPQFARMLQLIPLDRAELPFLVPVKKAQTPLPTSVLVHALGGNVDLLRWVATARAPRGLDVRRLHVPFWTSTLVQFCLHRRTRRKAPDAQAVLAVLIPEVLYVAECGDAEAAVGAMMVLCSLGAAFPLSPAAVRGLLDGAARLAASGTGAVPRAAVAACFALCASPEDARDPLAADTPESARLLSAPTLRALAAQPELRAQLSRALCEHDVTPFAGQILGALSAHLGDGALATLLEDVLDDDALPDALAERTCLRLLTGRDMVWVPRIELLAHVRERRPAALDAAVRTARAADASATWHILSAVLHRQATGHVPEAARGGDAALWLGVHSADAHAQQLAVERLLRAVRDGEVRAEDVLVREAVEAALLRGGASLTATLYAHGDALLRSVAPMDLLAWIAARLRARPAAAEAVQHVRFAAASLPAARVWTDIVWPHLLGEPAVAAAAAAAATALDEPLARAVPSDLSARASAPTDYALALGTALADGLAAQPEAEQLAQAQFLCSAASEPISAGGALALLVLAEVLARPLPVSVWTAVAYASTTLVHREQLLAGQPDVIVGARVDRAVVEQVLTKLSRRSVRLLSVQLLYSVVCHLPTTASASLFIAVQQRSTPLAQLLLHIYQTLHAPGVGAVAGERLVPVLFERLGGTAPAFLAGVWTAPTQAHEPAGGVDVAVLAAALATHHVTPPPEVPLRLMAMRHAALLVRAAAARDRALDWQTLLPSLLVVLCDPAPVLRDAASQLLVALASAVGDAREMYGFDAVYGEASAPLQYLDGATAARYVAQLAADAGAFVNDAAYLGATHAAMLGGAGKKDRVFRTRVLCYVLSHVVCWEDLGARCALLDMVREVSAPCKLETVAPLVRAAVEHAAPATPAESAYLQLLLGTADASAVPVLMEGLWPVFLRALQSDAACGLQGAALHALQSGLFAALPPDARQAAFVALAETLADPQRVAVPEAAAALRTLPLSDAVLVHVLRTLCAALVPDDDEPTRKRARSVAHAQRDEAMRASAVVLITVLESMQGRTLGTSAALVAALFDIVRAAIDLSATLLFNAEYLLQLAMQSLCDLFDHVTELAADVAQVVRADTIVSAIKVSSNTQSINHAILLLARFARLDAELVLHNIMPIFTFVGLNVLQRDDRFTLAVVEQTLRSIIPAFVSSVRPQVVNDPDARLALWRETRSLLRIFSDAATHIPRHRRHVFFRLLVDVLGADDFLAPVCMLLAERVAHRVSKTPANAAALLELPLSLLRAEPLVVRVHALNQVWGEVARLLAGSDDVFLAAAGKREYSEEHLSPTHQTHTLLLLLQLAMARTPHESAAEPALRQYAWHTVCVALPRSSDALAAVLADARAQVCRALPTADVLALVLALLRAERRAPGLVGVVPAAVSDASLQEAGLALLAARPVPHDARAACAPALGALHDALVACWEAGGPLAQPALGALHASLAQSTAAETGALGALVPRVLARSPSAPALDVLSELVQRLGVRALAQLAALVPYAVSAVEAGGDHATTAAGLHLLATLFRTLPQFTHAYVARSVGLLVAPALQGRGAARLRGAARRVQDTLVKRMPPGTMLDALQAAWDVPEASRMALLGVLQQVVREMDRAAVAAHYKGVFRFVLRALDTGTADELGRVATRAQGVYVALALKLNETQFRPLFLRTYDWAVIDLLDEDAPRVAARTLALYALVGTLVEHLQAMFVPYMGVLLDHAVETLSDDAHVPTWHAVVRALAASARADEGTFWNAARATRLVAPLVHALRQDERATDAEAALLALARAVPDDVFLRTLNTALMGAAGARDLPTRLHALSTCAALWEDHGMALLAFVPETVAALSELLDDADPRGAAAALRLRVQIEAALGEPLDAYLESA